PSDNTGCQRFMQASSQVAPLSPPVTRVYNVLPCASTRNGVMAPLLPLAIRVLPAEDGVVVASGCEAGAAVVALAGPARPIATALATAASVKLNFIAVIFR